MVAATISACVRPLSCASVCAVAAISYSQSVQFPSTPVCMDAQSSASRSSDATPSKKRRAAGQAPQPLGVANAEPERKRTGLPLLLCPSGAENPILAALGGTPRSQAAASGFLEPEPLDLSQCSTATSMDSGKEEKMEGAAIDSVKEEKVAPFVMREVNIMKEEKGAAQEKEPAMPYVKTEPRVVQETKFRAVAIVGKRKREDENEAESSDFVAYAREHIHSQEAGEEGFSIDPSERAVEHRASKVVRREILIASPAANDDEDWEGNAHAEVKMQEVEAVLTPSEHFDLQPIDIILHVFSFLVTAEDLKQMSQVSKKWKELTSRRSLYRSLPSVTPEGSVNWINFKNLGIKNKGTEGTCIQCCQRSTGKILAMKKARVFPKGEGVPYYMLRELAVLKGIRHDHIASLELISLAKDELHVFFPYVDKTLHEIINPMGDPSGGRVLPEAVIRKLLHQLLDAIAYCHRRGVLHRNLKPKHLLIKTADPENLNDATLQISDFALLFQIFSKLSTPTSETWPGFSSLPNYHFEFPHWKRRPLNRLFPGISDLGIDLLTKLLVYNPDQRITAEDALRHPYFSNEAPAFLPLTPKIPMDQMCYTMSRARIGPTPEHVELFHAYLRQTERESWKEIKYLSRQKTLRPAHRSMLVDWLIEVVDVFEMCLRTAFLAVNYTDRYLDIVMVKKTQFQLLGATCLHVASKCEDVSYIGVEDLAMCADNVYTSVEVLEMEEKLLNTLNFTLSVPTALDFLNIYERMIPPIQKKTSMLAHYLLELALQEYQFLKYLPSVVAACCLSMSMYTMDGFPMTKELVDACQYSWSDLKDCMGNLQTLYSNSPSNNLAVIKKRYSKAERCQVANVLPPTSFSMAF
ncbi:hypothetical protein PRIC2_014377 [Phytophthora ramorum]